jgi:transcription elongation factor greA
MLKDELQRLKTQDRPAVVQAIAEAREKGDLSENAEYDAARESQAFIEGRILELESKIAQFQVIDPTTLPDNGKVVFSATVTIEDVETGNRQTVQIVGNDESDTKLGRISVASPMARALIGKSEGDEVEVQAPGGLSEYEIISVQYI